MKVRIVSFLLLVTGILFQQCAVTGNYVQEEPQPEKSILVGAILVENFGIGEIYDSHTAGIAVKVVGKFMENGQEVTRTYRTKTDANGYYMIQNVDPGSYIVKGLEMNLVPNDRTYVTAIWDGERRFYEITEKQQDYAVRYWPPAKDGEVIDMGIMHFEVGITDRGHVLYNRFDELNNVKLQLPGIRYTMENPETYYKELFPDWGWFTQ